MDNELEKILTSEEFKAQLPKFQSIEEVQKFIETKGVPITVEDLNALVKGIISSEETEELDESCLTDVAGGSAVSSYVKAFKIGWNIGKKFAAAEKALYNKLGISY